MVCDPVGDVSLDDESGSLHYPVEILGVSLSHAVHGCRTHEVVEAGNLEPGDVLLEDVERHAAQVLGDDLLGDDGDAHLPTDPGVELGVLPLQLQRESLQLNKDIADSEAAREAGQATQSLQAEFPCEEPAPLQPGSDVLAAQTLGLGDDLLDGDRPPAQRGGELARHGVAHVGKPAVSFGRVRDVVERELVAGQGGGAGGEGHLPLPAGSAGGAASVWRLGVGTQSALGRLQGQLPPVG